MPLEFALRPRFDLKRPARRRRLAWPGLHPLVLPVGAYWLAAVGLTYAFIRSGEVDVADAAEHELRSGDSPETNVAPSEPPSPSPSPISTGAAQAAVTQAPTEPEPEPEPDWIPQAEPPPDEPLPRPDLDRASRTAPEDRTLPPQQTPPPAVEDEHSAPARTFEPEPVEEPAPRRAELESDVNSERSQKREEQTGSLPSCESAAATANQTIDVGSARGAPDLTRGAFAGVLEHGAYLTPCSIPPRTAIEICAAVQKGNVVGVTVTTEPRDVAINACVRRAVTRLRFPRSPQLDVTRTRFARER
jgi:hypothetical protein